ADRELHRSKA
nr:RecName: Full=36 kDa cell wall protein [Arabidopsis thaliana]